MFFIDITLSSFKFLSYWTESSFFWQLPPGNWDARLTNIFWIFFFDVKLPPWLWINVRPNVSDLLSESRVLYSRAKRNGRSVILTQHSRKASTYANFNFNAFLFPDFLRFMVFRGFFDIWSFIIFISFLFLWLEQNGIIWMTILKIIL